jgi:hypothetical protein
VVSVEAQAGVMPEMEASCRAHQAELALLVARPAEEALAKKPTPYADANAWLKAVYDARGKILKDKDGNCTLSLPEGLDPARAEALVKGARLFLDDACKDFITEAEFMAELISLRP